MRYIQATGWFILSLAISCSNDAITKSLVCTLNPWETTFFRFAFGILTILPFLLYQGEKAFITRRWGLHVGRGFLLFIAISLWGQGMKASPITTATIMSFSIPLFVLLLSPILLQEHVSWPLWVATLGGFTGILLVLQPNLQTFHKSSLFFVAAAALFGLLDILNKKYVTKEPTLSTLFYSSAVALIFTVYPTSQVWHSPSLGELIRLLVLGIGNNLILYFLLRAFSLASASSLAPFRYLELLMSMLVGYACFKELPPTYSYVGAAIIIPCTLFIGYYQAQQESNPHKKPA